MQDRVGMADLSWVILPFPHIPCLVERAQRQLKTYIAAWALTWALTWAEQEKLLWPRCNIEK